MLDPKDSLNFASAFKFTFIVTAAPTDSRYDGDIMTSETVVPVAETAADPTRFSAAYSVLEEALAAHAFPGCAFGVFAGGRVVHRGSLGRFIYEDNSPAVLPDTVFDVASITKVAATTAAAMLLHQRGLLDPDILVGDLLPGFIVGRSRTSEARQVTLRHLLAHSSGLPAYVEFFRTHRTPASLFRACLELPLEVAPGTRAEYSDPGFILLGKALEVLAGEHLPQFVTREIFDPLGMHSSSFCPRLSARHAIPPTEDDNTLRFRIIQGEVQDENAYILHGAAGHAGLFSNVSDLLLFAEEILRASGHSSTPEPSRLFALTTVERFAQRQEPAGSSRALGWDTPSENSSSGRYFSARSIGHLGFSGCSLWIDLDGGIAIALLTNRTWPDRSNQAIRQVRPAFHDAIRQAL